MLSVVIPAYNVENYITDCIESIRHQTFSDLEIIIVDDGSTDRTGQICDEFQRKDSRITVIHQNNQGVMTARINGIKKATGKYITFVDGDDYILPDMYISMIPLMQESDMVTCGIRREEKNGRIKENTVLFDDFEEGVYRGNKLSFIFSRMIYDREIGAAQRLIPSSCNKIYATDILKEVTEECHNRQIKYAEDSVMLYHYLLKCHSICITKDVFYIYRFRETSATHSENIDILKDINGVYIELKTVFENSDYAIKLMEQLQHWIMILIGCGLRKQMGFAENICPIEFILDARLLISGNLALYGAGKCGIDYFRQLKGWGKEPVIWVDKNYQSIGNYGGTVLGPSSLLEADFDKLIIAVGKEKVAEEIKRELLILGIEKDKIVWNKPLRAF